MNSFCYSLYRECSFILQAWDRRENTTFNLRIRGGTEEGGRGSDGEKETEAEGGGGREGGKEREGSCQERPVQPNGELALLGLCCPLVASVSRLGCPHLEPGNAGAGRSLCPSIFDSPMLKGGPSLFLMCFLGKL